MKIVFLDRDTIGPSVTITRPAFAHEWVEYGKTAAEDVASCWIHRAVLPLGNLVGRQSRHLPIRLRIDGRVVVKMQHIELDLVHHRADHLAGHER